MLVTLNTSDTDGLSRSTLGTYGLSVQKKNLACRNVEISTFPHGQACNNENEHNFEKWQK